MGLTIVLSTSKGESERESLERLLKAYNIQYDELVMGKPRVFIYVDKSVHKFESWDKALHEIIYSYNETRCEE